MPAISTSKNAHNCRQVDPCRAQDSEHRRAGLRTAGKAGARAGLRAVVQSRKHQRTAALKAGSEGSHVRTPSKQVCDKQQVSGAGRQAVQGWAGVEMI